MKKSLISITAAFVIAAGMMPVTGLGGQSLFGPVYAAEGSDTAAEIAEQFADPENDPFDYTQKSEKAAAIQRAEEGDTARDLRDVGGVSYVTPVKLQDPYGNCWGFAAITAAETSILGNEALKGNYTADIRKEAEGSGKIQMDLSEKHLSFFARTPINDPKNPQNGEGEDPYTGDGSDPVSAAYNMGAHAPTATSLFAQGVGPVLESENSLFEYKGVKGTVQKEWVEGKLQNYCYSDRDDWAIDESLRFSQSFVLQESFLLPSPASVDWGETDGEYTYNEAGTAAIKAQLQKNRAVQIGYHDDTFNIALGEKYSTYISENWAQYTFRAENARHAVCIVGYDDNYPAENFRHESDDPEEYSEEETVPPGDGAWLVKNSWGSGEEAFPNKGEGIWGIQVPKKDAEGKPVKDENGDPVMVGSGYFWLSYYDHSIATPEALDFGKNTEATDIIDQHDYLPVDEYRAAHVDKEVRMANIFTAGVCEELREVSCETTYPGTEVTFDIYLLADGYDSPTDGVLMETITPEPYEYGGFHKVSLNKPLTVMRGQSYSVVVTQKVPEDNGKSAYAFNVQMTYAGHGIVNKGESFLFMDGTWRDFSNKKFQDSLLKKTQWGSVEPEVDNFAIKGYAVEKPDIVLEVGGSGFLSLFDPETGAPPKTFLLAWLTDNSGTDYEGAIDWKIAPGGGDVIDMQDGRDPTRKTITCKKLGYTYILVSAEGVGTVVYPIKVYMPSLDITDMKVGKDSLTITTNEDFPEGLTGHQVKYRIKGTSAWTVKDIIPATKTFKLTGLKKGKKYEVELYRRVDTGEGDYLRTYYSYPSEVTSDTIGLVNTLKASGKTAKVRYAKLKKKKQTLARKKVIRITGAKGKVTYTKLSGNKKITINKKTGKITVKKKLKKGTYKVKVKVRAAGTSSYLPAVKTVTVKIKVVK